MGFCVLFPRSANHGLVPRPDQEGIDAAFVLFVADMARGFPSTERRQ
jgi:hypothetical protein